MSRKVPGRLQKSSSTKKITHNRSVAQNFDKNSLLSASEIPKSHTKQSSKYKRSVKSTEGENMNIRLPVKSEESVTSAESHEQKTVGTPLTSYVLRKGLRIRINDHVYLTQSDSNAPYSIGRIIKFIKNRQEIQVKIAAYYRQKDLLESFTCEKDEPRKLFAAFNCEKHHIDDIQGKCTVIHSSYINDMKSYIQLDDHFYFHELYDDFSTLIYKLIPTEKITNMPQHYINILKEKYHFIAAELDQVNEYLKKFQNCPSCNEWCSEQKSIECSSCKKTFHKLCIATPIKGKPKKGYIYECLECYGNARDELQEMRAQNASDDRSVISNHSDKLTEKHIDICNTENSISNIYINANNQPITGDKDTAVYINQSLRSTEGWIYRYFGKNSYLEDLDDPYDSIYPRVDRRIGSKYQAKIPELISTSDTNIEQLSKHLNQHTKKNSKKSRYIPLDCSDPILQLKTNRYKTKILKTIELIRSKPDEFALPVYSEAFLIKAMRLMADQQLGPGPIIDKLKSYSVFDFQGYLPFNEEEQVNFEKEIYKYGEDIEKIAESFPNRPYPQVVEYFYKWASKTVGIKGKSTSYKSKLRNMAKVITHGIEPLYIDDDRDSEKLIKSRSSARSNNVCAHCESKLEKITYQLNPETMDELKISGDLCSKCYTHWIKYFQLPTIYDEAVKLCKENFTIQTIPTSQKVNEHENINSNNESKEKLLIEKLGSSKRAKQLKQSLLKSGYDSSLLYENIPLPPIGCCALDSSLIIFKGIKRLELALPSPTYFNADLVSSSSSPQSSVKKYNSHHHSSINLSEQSPDSKSHSPIILELSIPSSCSICHSKQNPDQIIKCNVCKLAVHKRCYLLPYDFNQPDDWSCDECLNKSDENHYRNYACVLCRNTNSQRATNSPVKPTISGNWAHIICSLFLKLIYFTNLNRKYKVNGISEVPIEDWKKECSICHKDNSLSAKCKGCEINIHVTCALQNNCELGFKKLSNFSIEYLEPVIYCKNCKLFDNLEPLEPLSNLSFFDLKDLYKKKINKAPYTRKFSSSSINLSYPSKPTTLISEDDKNSDTTNNDKFDEFNLHTRHHSAKICSNCKIEFSPIWWHSLDHSEEYNCQSCHLYQILPDQLGAHKRKFVIKFKSQDQNETKLGTPEDHINKQRKITSLY